MSRWVKYPLLILAVLVLVTGGVMVKMFLINDWLAKRAMGPDDLIRQMTLAEKAGLMFQPPITFDDEGNMLENFNTSMGYDTYDVINGRLINHFNVFGSAPVTTMATWHNQIQKLAERTRLGIPITLSTDPRHSLRHGDRATSVRTEGFSLWPKPIGFGAIGEEETAKQFGHIANQEYRAVGIRMALHPTPAIATRSGRGSTAGMYTRLPATGCWSGSIS